VQIVDRPLGGTSVMSLARMSLARGEGQPELIMRFVRFKQPGCPRLALTRPCAPCSLAPTSDIELSRESPNAAER
jgi:hypothetical protein